MSNARSPREVCSTTMGTRGLMVLAVFRFLGRIPPGRAGGPRGRVYQPFWGNFPGGRRIYEPLEPGVQSWPEDVSDASFSGVQSLSRAFADSTEIAVACSTTRSSALR